MIGYSILIETITTFRIAIKGERFSHAKKILTRTNYGPTESGIHQYPQLQ